MNDLSERLKSTKIGSPLNNKPRDKIIIALDFGTTYSGVAYCFANHREPQPISVLHWPGSSSKVPKAPTVIYYDKKSPSSFKWGYSVKQSMDSIVGIKLLLDPTQKRPFYLPRFNAARESKSLPKSTVGVAADFISALYQHALKEIAETVFKGYLDTCEKEFVLSVPAVWSDAAKNATMKAAEVAGISPVTLIKEPEAAALYTAKSMDFCLKNGDAFVVCDAGGGTVDLISYEVQSIQPTLKLKELVPGKGGMAGSLGLNKRFAAVVEDLVGEDAWLELKRSDAFAKANRYFDNVIKQEFRGEEDESFDILFLDAGLENDIKNGLKADVWHITGEELNGIFEPMIRNILEMIEHQIQAVKIKRGGSEIRGIFLVGGFGGSRYLKRRVEAEFRGIDIVQPYDAWEAVAKGSVLSKLPKQAIVGSTSATRHYGVRYEALYDEKIDKGEETFYDRGGKRRCTRMQWYIKIGDDLLRDQVIKFSFYRDVAQFCPSRDRIFTTALYQCDDKDPPIHPTKSNSLRKNCSLVYDLSSIPWSKMRMKYDTNNKPYWEISFELIVALDSAIMTFSTEVDGQNMGSVQAEYD